MKLNTPPDILILKLTLKLSPFLRLPNERRTTKQLPQLFSKNWYRGDTHSLRQEFPNSFFSSMQSQKIPGVSKNDQTHAADRLHSKAAKSGGGQQKKVRF